MKLNTGKAFETYLFLFHYLLGEIQKDQTLRNLINAKYVVFLNQILKMNKKMKVTSPLENNSFF